MRKINLPICLFVALVLTWASCSKQTNVDSAETPGQQAASSGMSSQSISYNNITIDSSQTHVFLVPGITQSVIDHGSVKVYGAFTDEQNSQWSALPIINSCDSHLDIVSIDPGTVEVKNNLGADVSMSFRFDIVSNP